jgi:hypothetical protein
MKVFALNLVDFSEEPKQFEAASEHPNLEQRSKKRETIFAKNLKK